MFMSLNTVEYVKNVVMEVLKWQDNLINLVCCVLVKVVNKFKLLVFPESGRYSDQSGVEACMWLINVHFITR